MPRKLDLTTIIMAGGSGTRLWPSSRKNYPKQFLNLAGSESFIQMTARRLAPLSGPAGVFVVTDGAYTFNVINQLSQVLGGNFDRVIVEPAGRNTAPAIALSLRYMLDHGATRDSVLFFSPSDHIIHPEARLHEAVRFSLGAAKNHIVTFGIIPSKPETGYGYIEMGAALADGDSGGTASGQPHASKPAGDCSAKKSTGIFEVRSFREKPDLETARSFVESGSFLWNSGMFMFSIGVMLDAFKAHTPELADAVENMSYDQMVKAYETLPRQSIDYAVMEKAAGILCVPLDIEWNDIGSWDSLYEILPKDSAENAIDGTAHCLESANNLVISGGRLVTLLGVNNLAVIDTPDALLVCERSQSQKVKDLVSELAETRPAVTVEHVTTYRPWGSFTVLEEGARYKIKRIVVNPGARLSLQRHLHRSEHWVVVSGAAEVTIGERVLALTENQSVYVPINEAHRLTNPGRIPLEIIEVQNGEYVGEDDIIRMEDNYGRV